MEGLTRGIFDLLTEYSAPILKALGVASVPGGVLTWFITKNYMKRKKKAEIRILEADAEIRELDLDLKATDNYQKQITLAWEIIHKLEERNKAIEKYNAIILNHNNKLLAKNAEILKENDKLNEHKRKCSQEITRLKNEIMRLDRRQT